MKPRLFVLALGFVLLCVFSLYAYQDLDFNNESSAQILYDFGKIKEKKVTHIFEIRNNSKKKWRIKNVFVSCGCVSAKLIKSNDIKDNIIEPKEVFKVEVGIDTSHYTEDFEQFVYLQIFEENQIKILKLIMRGKVLKVEE
jgi:hypothetical protein